MHVFLPHDDVDGIPFGIEIDGCEVCGGYECDIFVCRTFEDDRHPLELGPTVISSRQAVIEEFGEYSGSDRVDAKFRGHSRAKEALKECRRAGL